MDISEKISRVRSRAMEVMSDSMNEWGRLLESFYSSKCESPIEKLLLHSYLLYLDTKRMLQKGDFCDSVHAFLMMPEPDREYMWNESFGECNYVDVQVPIGKYRADIVIFRRVNPFTDTKTIFETPRVVVECDGHDFHERTKEQAQRDKSRDRELQELGHPVLRFTGSEIWADAWTCAAQIDKFMSARIGDEWAKWDAQQVQE